MQSPELVRDLMTVGVATCAPGYAVVGSCALLLKKSWKRWSCWIREEGHALGVVSQEELVHAYAHGPTASG